jgi:hypothetical protein
MSSPGEDDHPYVAHYRWPAGGGDDEDARRDDEALAKAGREAERQRDFARWRVLRYAVAIPLVCLSIAGGAVAVIAAIVGLSSVGGGSVDVVTGVASDGTTISRTFTVAQLNIVVGVVIVLEIVLLCAAALLFAKRLHPSAWVVVTVLAIVATGGLVWGATAGDWGLSGVDFAYVAAFPVIAVAGMLGLWRARWLRVKWGEEAV